MNFLFTPNHISLLNSCYPPTSSLLTAGPDYSPNSQELSRLTYYASNHPGKLAKFGSELEKRVKAEARKAQSGNMRMRASLLITLAILRALATECRRDIGLFSPPLIASIAATVNAVPGDLEVVARAASVFTAWTTFTDGHLIGADSNMTKEYLSTLATFADLSCSKSKDQEVRNRTRLIGLAALTGALNSEALYNDSVQFRAQVAVMMKPILDTIFQAPIHVLEQQADAVKEAPASPYLAEFRTRPALERRAASIHVHVDGDTGPSSSEVSNAALRALFCLLEHASGSQLGHIMRASLDSLTLELEKWDQAEHCCWFAKTTVEWAQYQYRYAIPTWLVERLCENQNASNPLMLMTLTSMVTAVFNSSTPLVNLSTSDVISNLMNLLLRTNFEDGDPLIPALVECISSLGRHVYYSDQIQDLAGEIINRIVAVEVQGALSLGKQSRSQALRSLISGLLGLIHSAEKVEAAKERSLADPPRRRRSSSLPVASPASQIANPDLSAHGASRRTKVPPDIWQDTLSLLCNGDYGVRADYSLGLIYYLEHEIPAMGDKTESGGVKRIRRIVDSPFPHSADVSVLLNMGDFGTKFLNAIHAHVYALATSPTLGIATPEGSMSNGPITSEPEGTASEGSELNAPSHGRRSVSSQVPRARKVSVVQRLLERAPSRISAGASASLSDYGNMVSILCTVHREFPIRGIITSVPMLLALDKATALSDSADPEAVLRANALRIVVAKVWLTIGQIWECAALVDLANKALATVPTGDDLPVSPDLDFAMHPAYEPIPVPSGGDAKLWTGISSEQALYAICACPAVHESMGLDMQSLLARFSAVEWTPEWALRDSVERSTTFESTVRGDGVSPLLKITPALMHIDNMSLQSLAKSTRGIGVTDLREALEGRSSMSNPALVRPPSVSTLDHASSIGGESRLMQPRSRTKSKRRPTPSRPDEVREVLNRLGIGKQNGSLLRSSFAVQASKKPEP
ncbi:unnamed protein product [Mycena citricolor]|uniref:Cellular morphogenesis-related protein n=1 Tax=Mycena citricolor TaxID=2018698 RepID=A0AAD2HGK0_9AGAR|nr:unnamed protein product [Mycena citricolor]